MGIGKNINNELTQWGGLAVLLIVLMIMINKIKVSGDGQYICDTSVGGVEYAYYNSTGNICCNGTSTVLTSCAGSVNQTAINTIGTTSDLFVTGFSEPGSWVVIVVVGLVGFALIKFMQRRKGN